MFNKIRTGIIVAILSGLIWVFAEQAVTKEGSKDIIITLDEINRSGDLYVQFLDELNNPIDSSQQAVNVTVRGPAARILELNLSYINQLILQPGRMEVDLSTIVDKKRFNVPVINLLGKGLNSIDGRNFLQVTNTEPTSLNILITKLISKKVPVAVYSNAGDRLTPELIEPPTIDGFIVQNPDNPVEATVRLTADQQLQALQQEIIVPVKIDWPNRGQGEVRIRLKQIVNLVDDKIRLPRLYVQKPYTMEDFRVVIEDLDAKLEANRYSPLEIRGTTEAVKAYRESEYQLVLKITELDRQNASSEISRPLEYYIPPSITGLEIINTETRPIKFRLERIKPTEEADGLPTLSGITNPSNTP